MQSPSRHQLLPVLLKRPKRVLVSSRTSLLAVAVCALSFSVDTANLALAARGPEHLAVAATDTRADRGIVRRLQTNSPWDWVGDGLQTGVAPRLRAKGRRLFAISRRDASITQIDIDSWQIQRTYDLGNEVGPLDLAVVNRRRAYVSVQGESHLLRLDLKTGATTQVFDFQPLVAAENLAEASGLQVHQGRLYVQLREVEEEPKGKTPAHIVVIDLATETIIDADPIAAGIQAITLAGTFGKMKMQVLRRQRWLVLSATGIFFDQGGIEAINLDTLASEGLLIREEDGLVGAELGAFVMLNARRGYLAYSTDLLLSSHLNEFRSFGVPTIEELLTSLDYFIPALVRSRRHGVFFAPEGGSGKTAGVHVYRSRNGERLTAEVTPSVGPASDLELLRGAKIRPRR